MYYVYDNYGSYVAKTDSFHWAKKMANANDGYVMEWYDGFYYMAYETMEFLFSDFWVD